MHCQRPALSLGTTRDLIVLTRRCILWIDAFQRISATRLWKRYPTSQGRSDSFIPDFLSCGNIVLLEPMGYVERIGGSI